MRRRPARRSVVGAVCAGLLALGTFAAPAASATVWSPSGASGSATLGCVRMWGYYGVQTTSSYMHYKRQYVHNAYTGQGSWGGWILAGHAFPQATLPSMGTVLVYVQFAYWNGTSWELVGEWASVYNGRGEFAGYGC